MWLECAVEEVDDRGRKKRTPDCQGAGARHSAGLSHLTAAGYLYMRRSLLGLKKLGLEQSLATGS